LNIVQQRDIQIIVGSGLVLVSVVAVRRQAMPGVDHLPDPIHFDQSRKASWTPARQQYGAGGVAVDSDVQPPLPFLLPRLVSA
jgi:hypothetical protein